MYGRDDAANSFLMNCIVKFEAINVQIIARVVVQFIQR